MIFKFHTAFALGLIALVAGTYLVARMRSTEMCCRGFAKVIGWLVVIAAFLSLVCTSYYGYSYWSTGQYGFGKMWHGKPMWRHPGKPPMRPMMEEREAGEGD